MSAHPGPGRLKGVVFFTETAEEVKRQAVAPLVAIMDPTEVRAPLEASEESTRRPERTTYCPEG